MDSTIALIKNHKSIALLAPAFILDFPAPAIIGMLKKLGFDKVTELTYGAKMVNWHYAEYIKAHPEQKYFITSPCPTTVALIQASYPELAKYLVPIVSPMAAMAKICKKHYPDHKVVFISPCFAKKLIEAPKYPGVINAVIPLSELKVIFENQGIRADDFNRDYVFDSFVQEYTKIYPVSGGLAVTSHIQKLFKPGEITIVDGIANLKKTLDEVKSGQTKFRFFDFLNCPGGCIGGPAINSKGLSTAKRREIVKKYVSRAEENRVGNSEGTIDYADGVDFSAKF